MMAHKHWEEQTKNRQYREMSADDLLTRLRDGETDFSGVRVPELSDFRYQSFKGVNFEGADLGNVCFNDSVLYGVNFSWANLENVQFQRANMTHSHLYWSNLDKVYFTSANLENADFGTVDLGSCIDLDKAYFKNTRFDHENRKFMGDLLTLKDVGAVRRLVSLERDERLSGY